jgi:hypothetical protein
MNRPNKRIRTLHGGQVQINKLLNKRCYGTKVTTQRKRKKSHIYIYIYILTLTHILNCVGGITVPPHTFHCGLQQ